MTFALVATGVGMLLGAVLRNAEQATSIGPPVGIALGMLGGCMWPLAIVPAPHARLRPPVPQAWAMDAFIALIARNAGLAGIPPPARRPGRLRRRPPRPGHLAPAPDPGRLSSAATP